MPTDAAVAPTLLAPDEKGFGPSTSEMMRNTMKRTLIDLAIVVALALVFSADVSQLAMRSYQTASKCPNLAERAAYA